MKKIHLRFGVLAVSVLLAALSRLLPHPPNFTAIGAMALFGGAYFSNRWSAFGLPLVAMFISDLILNNIVYAEYTNGQFVWLHDTALWIYGAIGVSVLLGQVFLKKINVQNVLMSGLGSAVLFFVISNLGVFFNGDFYPKTGAGLMACFTAALPYFGNTVVSELLFAAVLFGGFEWTQRHFPQLRMSF